MHSKLWSLALTLLLPGVAGAATDVIGNLNADARWTKAGSPYRLTGDVVVGPGATLTIEPGVVVEATATDGLGTGTDAGRVEFTIRGALVANGTAAEPITLRGVSATAGSWYGLVFEAAAKPSSVSQVSITSATYGILGRANGSAFTLADVTLANGVNGLLWASATPPVLQRLTVRSHSGTGIELQDDGTAGATVTVRDSAILSSGVDGLVIKDRVRATVLGTTVRQNTGTGIVVHPQASATVERSHLVGNRVGLEARTGSALTFRNNVVVANLTKGLDLTQSGTNVFSLINNTLDRNRADPVANTGAGVGIHVRAVTSAPNFILRNTLITNHGTYGLQVEGATAPATNHNDVWNNGTNYLGAVPGVGSVSVNPLYEQPVSSTVWRFVSNPIVVSNPGNNYVGTWNYTQGGALRMRVLVTALSTEAGFDILRITDAGGVQVDAFDGSKTGTSNPVTGSRINLRFTTDGSGASSGFTVSGYEWLDLGTFNYRLSANSPVLDLGSNLGAPAEDADGTPRPFDGELDGTATVDPGAYEWHGNIAPLAVGADELTVLPNTKVTFDASRSRDPDGSVVSYDWDFGDGSARASTVKAEHTYTATGTYTVRLTVTDDKGATGTDVATVTVVSNLPPTANAGPDLFVEPGLSVTLDAGGSTDSDGTLVAYAWNFGDGTPAGNGRTVTHTYVSPGVYTATLTVTDNRGATATDTVAVVVQAPTRNAAPTASAGGSRSVTLGDATSFDASGSTDSDGSIVSYSWSFGDGSTGTGARTSHTYAAAGTYLVVLTVEDDRGARDEASLVVTVIAPPVPDNAAPVAEAGVARTVKLGETVGLDGSASSDTDGTIASYAWDFGDGSADTGAKVDHTYAAAGSYVVTLIVTDDKGAMDRDVTLVVVQAPANASPVAQAGGPYAALLGTANAFDGSASSDADGVNASNAWDFGDGSKSGEARPSHTYAAAGTYLVRLKVVDNLGATAEATALVTISEPRNTPPVARMGQTRAVTVGQALPFDASTSSDADGTIASYTWDFGDGSTASGASVAHTYASAGSYLVRLTVTDDKGAIGQDSALVTVGAPPANRAPVADAGASRAAELGAPVLFDASGSLDADGTLTVHAWDFGDGETGTGAQVQHAYARPGSYLVRLTVTDNQGASAEDFVLVSVAAPVLPNAAPVAEAGQDVSGHSGQSLTFTAAASVDVDGSVIAYQWDFGDGSTASGLSAAHAYQAGGSYTVTLTVIDNAGARATDSLQVHVNALPQPDAGAARTGDVNQELAFDGGASRDTDGTIASYAWDFGDGSTASGAKATHAYKEPGFYTVRLTVTDDKGATSRAEALVVINRPPVVQPPPADSGCAAAPGSASSMTLLSLALALGFVARRRRV